MAKFITRTFEGTKANCMVYNLNSKKIENMVLVVETTDEKKLEKAYSDIRSKKQVKK